MGITGGFFLPAPERAMAKTTERFTKVILKNFAVFFPLFYATYYVIAVILAAACGMPSFDPRLPFDFNTFGPHLGSAYALASWLSLISAMIVGPVVYFFAIKNTPMTDDYTFTLCFVHSVLCCGVSGGLPIFYDIGTNQAEWSYAGAHGFWWATMIVMGNVSASISECAVLYLHDLITSIRGNHS